MAKHHSPGFLALVDDAKESVKGISAAVHSARLTLKGLQPR
jgi:hypothetical protein